MANKELFGWCGHPVGFGSIICDSCRNGANKIIASKKNRKKKVNG